jgi:hypothetical protein
MIEYLKLGSFDEENLDDTILQKKKELERMLSLVTGGRIQKIHIKKI